MTEVGSTPTAIEIDRLSKRYETKDGPVLALDNVSFAIRKASSSRCSALAVVARPRYSKSCGTRDRFER